MKLVVPKRVADAAVAAGSKALPLIEAKETWRSEINVESRFLTPEDLNLIEAALTKEDTGLRRRINLLRDAGRKGKKFGAGSLEPLAEAIRVYFGSLPNHRFYDDADGHLLPYLLTKCRYNPPESRGDYYTPAHVNLAGHAISRGAKKGESVTLHARSVEGGKTIEEVLAAVGWLPETPDLNMDYEAEMEIYRGRAGKVGTQFLAYGSGRTVTEKRWGSEEVALVREGKPSKAVLDDGEGYGDESGVISTNLFPVRATEDNEEGVVGQTVPIHPFLQVFDLTHPTKPYRPVDRFGGHRGRPDFRQGGRGDPFMLRSTWDRQNPHR